MPDYVAFDVAAKWQASLAALVAWAGAREVTMMLVLMLMLMLMLC